MNVQVIHQPAGFQTPPALLQNLQNLILPSNALAINDAQVILSNSDLDQIKNKFLTLKVNFPQKEDLNRVLGQKDLLDVAFQNTLAILQQTSDEWTTKVETLLYQQASAVSNFCMSVLSVYPEITPSLRKLKANKDDTEAVVSLLDLLIDDAQNGKNKLSALSDLSNWITTFITQYKHLKEILKRGISDSDQYLNRLQAEIKTMNANMLILAKGKQEIQAEIQKAKEAALHSIQHKFSPEAVQWVLDHADKKGAFDTPPAPVLPIIKHLQDVRMWPIINPLLLEESEKKNEEMMSTTIIIENHKKDIADTLLDKQYISEKLSLIDKPGEAELFERLATIPQLFEKFWNEELVNFQIFKSDISTVDDVTAFRNLATAMDQSIQNWKSLTSNINTFRSV